MEILVILFLLAMLLIGIAAGIWHSIKFIASLFAEPKPVAKPVPLRSLAVPQGIPTQARISTNVLLTRAQTLDVLEAEVGRAMRANRLGEATRKEFLAYLEAERGRLSGARRAETPDTRQETTPASEPASEPAKEKHPQAVPVLPAAIPAPAAEPAPQPAVVFAKIDVPVSSERKPEAIRAMIAKLHADAQAPEVPEGSAMNESVQAGLPTPAPSDAQAAHAAPFQPPAQEKPTAPVREEARAGLAAHTRMAPAAPVLASIQGLEVNLPDTPGVRPKANIENAERAPQKALAERLFTPENVRILQSIGIGIIFISAVAFVRMNMWEGASAWQQLALLLGGTTACMGAGYALRRWTSLRITGLGFLVLGQLAIVLDSYAALVNQGAGHPPLYPFAPSSLWMISMLVFSASAWWHARDLDEPLFEAFTFFGAMAAYGSGAVFAGAAGMAGERWWMMPAAYVPALAVCAILAAWVKARALAHGDAAPGATRARLNGAGWRRWTVWWWMDATWKIGAGVLTVLVPAAAIFSGRADVAAQFGWHAAALLALGVGLAFESMRSGRLRGAAAGALALLAIAPLYAFAHAWPLETYALALALPGAGLALLAALLRKLPGDALRREPACAVYRYMGSACAALGAAWALLAWNYFGLSNAHAAWCAASLLAAGVSLTLLDGEAWGAWPATFGAGFLLATVLERAAVAPAWWPAIGIGAALLLHAAWIALRPRAEVKAQGRQAADALAGSAVLQLLLHTLIVLPNAAAVSAGTAAGWCALAAYLLAMAVLYEDRRVACLAAGVGALGSAATMSFYALGYALCTPAPWLALLSIAAQTLAWAIFQPREDAAEHERSETHRNAVCVGACVILVNAIVLALVQAASGLHGDAAVSFALATLAAAGLSFRLRQAPRPDSAYVALSELASLGLYAAAGTYAALWLEISGHAWPLASALFAAGALLAGMLGEALAPKPKLASAPPLGVPFFETSAVAAVLWTLVASLQLLNTLAPGVDGALLLQNTWAIALVPLFLALRPRASARDKDAFFWQVPCGTGLALLLLFFAGVQALCAACWSATCSSAMREASAVYFLLVLVASAGVGVLQRRAFAPLTAALALLGLTGCAYGGWALPHDSFGLACVLLAAFFGALGAWLERREPAQARACAGSAALILVLGIGHLLVGLIRWPVGSVQAWGVAAWALLALGAWRASARSMQARQSAAGAFAWLASAAGILGIGHALRWAGLEFAQFGPGMAGAALALLALREAVRHLDRAAWERLRNEENPAQPAGVDAATNVLALPGRSNGVLLAACMAGTAAFVLGLLGWWNGETASWTATLGLEALSLCALALIARRDLSKPNGALTLTIELAAWACFALATVLGMHLAGPDWLLSPVTVVLAGAVYFALGMAAEALSGALLPADRRTISPRPFLESRHLAGLGMAMAGALWATASHGAFGAPDIQSTWRAILCAGFVAAYAGMAEWSAEDLLRRTGRMAAGIASYLVLIPAGYLCLLKAHATGSSWGALWFLALAPVQLLAAHLLDREKHAAQALLARAGALLVSLGAIALAFAGNAQRLAEVPCATFGLLALLALIARACSRAEERKAYALAALVALSGAVFYAVRVVAGDAAFGVVESSVWEWPALAALGLALTVAGGLTRWEPDAKGRSLAGVFGCGLTAIAAAVSLLLVATNGMEAHYLHAANCARFEAFIVALLLGSGMCLAARRLLDFREGAYLAPLTALAGYVLYVWTMHPAGWEWYTLPAAVLLFVWARSRAAEAEAAFANGAADAHTQSEISLLLGLACAAALLPSFAQALAYSPEALYHYYVLVTMGLTLVGGAMFARRKIPLLSGSAAVLLGTLVKTAQWAAHKEVIYPVLGIGIGFAVLAVGCLFESRMNRAIRQTVDRVRAEARMFWVSWE